MIFTQILQQPNPFITTTTTTLTNRNINIGTLCLPCTRPSKCVFKFLLITVKPFDQGDGITTPSLCIDWIKRPGQLTRGRRGGTQEGYPGGRDR